MFITDSQIHIWAADTPARPWPPLSPEIRVQRSVPLEVAEIIAELDRARVNRAVLVPPGWDGERNDVALSAAERHPSRLAVMGLVDRHHPSANDFPRWLEQPGMLGIRVSLSASQSFDEFAWIWPEATKAAIPLMLRGPGRLGEIGAIAEQYPELKLIVDHLGLSMYTIRTAGYPDIGPMLEPLIALARFENVAVKVSALPSAVDEGYPFPSLSAPVRDVVDAFGAERCMWGSDLSQLKCPYDDWVRAASEGLGCLSEHEVEWLMGRSLSRWLNWPQPE